MTCISRRKFVIGGATLDSWEQYAPMLTPRHGLGAAVIGDFIHVAGGGPIMGGAVRSAVHEAFTLG
jgi:hypothetical protein